MKLSQESIHVIILGFSSAIITAENIRGEFKYKTVSNSLLPVLKFFFSGLCLCIQQETRLITLVTYISFLLCHRKMKRNYLPADVTSGMS